MVRTRFTQAKLVSLFDSTLSTTAIILITAYQMLLRGILAPACRYSPSCSDYMAGSILAVGFQRGFKLGLKRLLGCHPLHQ